MTTNFVYSLDTSTKANNVVFGNTSAPENLPEIQRITGEEEEENILQVCYLYVCVCHLKLAIMKMDFNPLA